MTFPDIGCPLGAFEEIALVDISFGRIQTFEPLHPVFGKLLDPWLQLLALHTEVVYSANSWYQLPGVSTADSVHQGSTD